MDRRAFISGIAGGLLAAPLAAGAQQAGKVYRIGHLMLLPPETLTPLIKALEAGLQDLGYIDGRNVIIEHRSADGRPERLPEVAAELVRLKVDVIVAGVNPGIAAAKEATRTIPIVMVYGADPIGVGFIASFRRLGGDITGGTFDFAPDTYGKTLQLLKEIVPKISRVAFLWNPAFPGAVRYAKATEEAARQIGMRLQSVKVQAVSEFEHAFASMSKDRATAVFVFGETVTFHGRGQIAELAARYRLPAVSGFKEFVEAGALMSYGPSLPDFWRRAAIYIDKILKGANPSELPVEQPTKFELVVNLQTAKARGLTIPPSLLQRADQVIE